MLELYLAKLGTIFIAFSALESPQRFFPSGTAAQFIVSDRPTSTEQFRAVDYVVWVVVHSDTQC